MTNAIEMSEMDLMAAEGAAEVLTSAENSASAEAGSEEDDEGGGDDDDEEPEFIMVDQQYYYLEYVMRVMAVTHTLLSLCILIAYYHLKVGGAEAWIASSCFETVSETEKMCPM